MSCYLISIIELARQGGRSKIGFFFGLIKNGDVESIVYWLQNYLKVIIALETRIDKNFVIAKNLLEIRTVQLTAWEFSGNVFALI